MTAGALYAVAGDAGWMYYGQVTPEKKIGFFRIPVDRTQAPWCSGIAITHGGTGE